jgi:hypothetical protein
MVTRLLHGSGQWIQDGGVPLIPSKQDMQGLGSALTYSRRYGLMAMVGIAPEDDDGNAAIRLWLRIELSIWRSTRHCPKLCQSSSRQRRRRRQQPNQAQSP